MMKGRRLCVVTESTGVFWFLTYRCVCASNLLTLLESGSTGSRFITLSRLCCLSQYVAAGQMISEACYYPAGLTLQGADVILHSPKANE